MTSETLEQSNTGPDPKASKRLWIIATAMIVVFAILVRLALNFRHAMLPGTDAAYYPMQTQWLLQHGELQLPAMPLVFWLQAILANVIMWLSGTSLEHAVSLSSRLADGFCQPWSAVPIMLLGYRWSGGRRSAVWLCAAAAVFAVMSPPIMRMAGDLQKNSLGMLWMAFSIWAVREALASPRSLLRWGCLALVFVLAGVTHVGAFGATCVILVGCLLAYAFFDERFKPTRENFLYAVQTIGGVALVTVLVAWLVPSQVRRLGTLLDFVIGFSGETLLLSIAVYALLFWVLKELWQTKQSMQRCDLAVAIGVSFGLAILVAPVFGGVWAMRFQLMTAVPVAVMLALVVSKLEVDRKPKWLQTTILSVVAVFAAAACFVTQGPVLSEAAADELRQLGTKVAAPEKTLVVAPHGFEFWAGYLMHTRITKRAVPVKVTPYEQVLLLKPSNEASGQRPRHQEPRRDRRPPPERRNESSDHDPRSRQNELIIPASARPIYQSKLFTLYEYPIGALSDSDGIGLLK